MSNLSRVLSIFSVLSLTTVLGATVGCFRDDEPERVERAAPVKNSPPLPAGTYQIQSIAYDDADGAYRVFLLDPPPSTLPLYTSTELKLARITDEEIAAGNSKPRLVVDATGTAAHLPPEFAIQYTHNEVEERDGQTVVVQQHSSTWSPFMSAMAGAAVGNMLFGPRYYYPPPYVGGSLVGFGGSGVTRADAATSYTQQHGKAPQPAKLSASGYSKSTSGMKSSGKGIGSSRLKSTTKSAAPPRSKGGFGRGFGRRR